MSEEQNGFEGWAIMELMGHRRLAGHVSEQEIAGAGMLRIDVYDGDGEQPYATQFYSPQALYALTPTTEEIARAMGRTGKPRPVRRYELEPPATRGEFGDEPFTEEDEERPF